MSDSAMALVIPGRIMPNGLELPESMTFDEWVALGETLKRVHGATLWWIGDWLNYGERRYGNMYRDALDATEYEYGTLRVAKHVSSQFELLIRINNLTWSHHRLVAPLPLDIALEWLRRCAEKKWSIKEFRQRIKRGLPVEADGALVLPPSVEIYDGDFKDVLAHIPDGSVEAIITDPPYPFEFLPLYAQLAAFAKRVLVPGGSLLCMVGQSYLPQIHDMLREHLDYHWEVGYLALGASTQLWDRRVLCGWKPVLWYVNGDYDGAWRFDVIRSESEDKRFHEWGQSESGMAALVDGFTQPGDLVVDPFLGAGTTGVAAVRLGRRFKGCDVDADAAAVARRRIAETRQ